MSDNPALQSTRIQLEHSELYLICHDELSCRNKFCTLHNRSDHIMREFPQHWRGDRGLMERICPHGIGHPDPDEIDLDKNAKGVHGCDGCCSGWTLYMRCPDCTADLSETYSEKWDCFYCKHCDMDYAPHELLL